MNCHSILAAAVIALAFSSPAAAQEPIRGAEEEVARVAAAARAAYSVGRYRDALMMLQDVHGFAAAELGPGHPAALQALTNIAVVHQLQGNLDAALPLALQASGGLERAVGPDHPDTLNALANLAQLYVARGERPAAEPLLRRVHRTRERVLGAAHASTLEALLELAVFLNRDGRLREIRTELERGATLARDSQGENSPIAIDLRDAAAAAARPPGLRSEANAG